MSLATRANLEAELVSQLQVASNSSLFPSTRITSLIKNAYIWATQLFIWTDLVRAKCTDSVANQEYYDYPEEFRSLTIVRLTMDDLSYKRKNFEDYLAYRENNPGSTFKMFSSFGRQFFIHPTPTANGTNNIDVWGAIQADELDDTSDETIFTNSKEQGNEAVVRKALSVALKRVNPSLAESEEKAAILTLGKLNQDENKYLQRDQRVQHPKFSVPDFFAGNGGRSTFGNFGVNIEEAE